MPGASSGFLDFEDRAAQRAQEAQRAQYMQMLMAQQAMAQQAAQRQMAARQAVSRGLPALLGPVGGGIPMPGQPMPQMGGGLPPPPPAAPAPGSLSPGGGNPAVMPPPQQPAAPAAGQPAGGPGPANAAPAAAAPPPPFRPMPTSPMAPAGPAGGIPMPAGAPPASPLDPPKPMPSVADIVARMDKAGISPEMRLDALDQLEPILAASQKAELDHFKMIAGAQDAALKAASSYINAMAATKRADTGVVAEDRRGRQGDVRADQRQQEIDLKKEKEARLRRAAASGTGATGPLKSTELIYPKKPDGTADQTAEPIGIRGLTKTGKIVYLDAEGHQTPTLAGLTAKQSKAGQVNVRDTVRSNLVAAGARNALARLDEIEKKYGDKETTSILFGQEPKGLLEAGAHAGVRTLQSDKQQQVDADWGSFIDEAIPVFTGGLRGSDAFRRFLIAQAPVTGSKPGSVAERRRLFRQNIIGTQQAFAKGGPLPPMAQNALQAFASNPQYWGPGVTKEQVDQVVAASRGGGEPGGEQRSFANEAEAAAANLPKGTKVIINGVSGTWQ